jgi:hypothetical protein
MVLRTSPLASVPDHPGTPYGGTPARGFRPTRAAGIFTGIFTLTPNSEVGTVVEILAPDVYEVEFCDDEGQTYVELALRGDQLIALHNLTMSD